MKHVLKKKKIKFPVIYLKVGKIQRNVTTIIELLFHTLFSFFSFIRRNYFGKPSTFRGILVLFTIQSHKVISLT